MSYIKLTLKQAQEVIRNYDGVSTKPLQEVLEKLHEASKDADPWWVIALKTLAYLIGLLLAGVGTSTTANALNIF